MLLEGTPRAVFEGAKATGVFAFGEEESPKGVAVVQKGHIEAPAKIRGGAEIVTYDPQGRSRFWG